MMSQQRKTRGRITKRDGGARAPSPRSACASSRRDRARGIRPASSKGVVCPGQPHRLSNRSGATRSRYCVAHIRLGEAR
jgi:hypothetical protein